MLGDPEKIEETTAISVFRVYYQATAPSCVETTKVTPPVQMSWHVFVSRDARSIKSGHRIIKWLCLTPWFSVCGLF